ncbi:MAG TPA: protein kinase [Pyrinomonadaceae bacterium]|nr:protein kinase [Pyrinomonadaceae bacterium]
MKPPNWDRLQEIYHAALALPPSERNAFVTSACEGDKDLFDKVNSLLKTNDSFLKDPIFHCPPLVDSLVGTTIEGRYEIQRELQPGGMGRVYVAKDLQLPGRLVVIKVVSQTSTQDPDAVRRAKREIQALTVIDHPNVVSVFGAGEVADGKPYIAMQYIDGVTLRSQIESNGMDVKRAAPILKQIGAALSHVHNRGVLHRDLKPENIMIQVLSDGTEVVKILDFGIAKLKDPVVATSTVNTVAIGTIAYMSPEQLREGARITVASDIYSMAVVACEMITGTRPPPASERPVSAVDLPPELAKNASAVLLHALSFEPENRYQSAKQFGDDLEKALLDGGQKRSGDPPPLSLLPKLLVVFGSTLVLALLAYVTYVIFFPPIPPPSKSFKYWVMVQKMRDGKEYDAPYKSNGSGTFENRDRFQLMVSTTEPGYLYIFNEGPPESDTASFRMIYPNKATNNGAASVGANQTVQCDWITFRGPPGAENFWIAWSVSPVSELELAKNEAFKNSEQALAGDQLVAVREFLKTTEAKVNSRISRYSETQLATVRGKTDILVVHTQFKHR